MERLLHYVWKHKIFSLSELRTADGQAVEVIDTGLSNSNAGPDFLNAKIKIGGMMWIGNVEIHCRSKEWHTHRHDKDKAYDNVVLHVVESIDADAITSTGRKIPQLRLSVPDHVRQNYSELLAADKYPPCHKIIPKLPRLMVHSFMNKLMVERLERKTEDIKQRVKLCNGSWEEAFFITLARNYGFGVNADAFEVWASTIPQNCIAHHRDDIFQIEALFMGQAGLLDDKFISKAHYEEAIAEGHLEKLRKEYAFLAHKFSLTPMNATLWRFLRLRPQNFPYIRLSQLANLYCSRNAGLSRLIECDTLEKLRDMMQASVTPYWETHYTFGSVSRRTTKRLSGVSRDLIIINTAIPMLFAYGRHKSDEGLCQRALSFLEQLKAESNSIVSVWRQCGLEVDNAGDSQALIQLKREYCDRKDCLHCRIGGEFLLGARRLDDLG